MSGLSPLRRRILTMLHDHLSETGLMLTQREIADQLRVSHTCIGKNMTALEEGGYLDRSGSRGRHFVKAVRLPGRTLASEEIAWCHANAARVRAMMALTAAVP